MKISAKLREHMRQMMEERVAFNHLLGLRIISFEPILDQSVGGQSEYLTRKIVGLGKVKAQALVDLFGVDTLAILRETPERALEVRGITDATIESITGAGQGMMMYFLPTPFLALALVAWAVATRHLDDGVEHRLQRRADPGAGPHSRVRNPRRGDGDLHGIRARRGVRAVEAAARWMGGLLPARRQLRTRLDDHQVNSQKLIAR